MTLPAEVITATVVFGPITDHLGRLATGTVEVTPDAEVIWAATNDALMYRKMPVTLVDGVGQLELPANDQPGFIDGQGNEITGWTYNAKLVGLPGRKDSAATFATPTGGAEDVVIHVPVTAPIDPSHGTPVALPGVLSVAGYTGAVSSNALAASINVLDLRGFLQAGESLPNSGGIDATWLLQRAINAAGDAVPVFGPIAIALPAGRYRINSNVYWRSGVGVIGQGRTNTAIAPTGAAVFGVQSGTDFATLGWFDDLVFANLTIDCTAQVSSANNVGMKGIALRYLRNSRFENVWITNSWATAFGCDFLQDVKFINCVALNAGRGVSAGSFSFGSGFGIGTGEFDRESVQFLGCTAIGAQSAGFFIERLASIDTPADALGFLIDSCVSRGNYNGILLSGGHGVTVSNTLITDNVFAGIAFNGPSGGRTGDKGALIVNNEIIGNGTGAEAGTAGIAIRHAGEGGSTIRGNIVNRNTGPGIYSPATAQLGPEWHIDLNQVQRNSAGGILIDATLLVRASISGNTVRDNGTGDGIRLAGDLVEPVVVDNTIQGHTGVGLYLAGSTTTCARPLVQGNTVTENKVDGILNEKDTPDATRITGNLDGAPVTVANITEHPTNGGGVGGLVVVNGFSAPAAVSEAGIPSGTGSFIRVTATAAGSITVRPDKKSDATLTTKTVTYSCWIRVSNPKTIIRVGGTAYWSTTTQRSWFNGGIRATTGWQRVAITIPMPTTGKRADLVLALDSATIGDTLDIDAIMLSEGTALWPWQA